VIPIYPLDSSDAIIIITLLMRRLGHPISPDAYLTWELEVEQHFAYLRYPENLRVSAATCEFTYFDSIWWSEHCRVNHANIPATWLVLKHAMCTRFVPPH
jgi:hypothetical protein